MNILTDIINWVETKSLFWQIGVDKLIRNNTLNPTDINDLKEVCRAEVGLSTKTFAPVDFTSLRAFVSHSASSDDIIISKINGIQNINALSPTAVLDFAPSGMTVVYGDNGAGKSSYVSILKHVCNTRGQKPTINDNIYNPTSKGKDKIADVEYSKDSSTFATVSLLNGLINDTTLKAVDVFDTLSAHHYIDGEDEIAFIPQGLSYIEKLASTLQQIEKDFLSEIATLNQSKFDTTLLGLNVNSGGGKFVSTLSKTTTLNELRAQSQWSDLKAKRVKELETLISTLKATDPQHTLQTNLSKINRFRITRNKFEALENNLISQLSLDNIVAILNEYSTTLETLKASSENIFSGLPVTGVGGNSWKQLWESARKFYEENKNGKFPDTTDDSSCPLCFQILSDEAKARFANFEEFVKHDTQQTHDKAKIDYDKIIATLNSLSFDFADQEPTCLELEAIIVGYKDNQATYLQELVAQRKALLKCLTEGKSVESLLPPTLTKNCKDIVDSEILKLESANEVLRTQSIADVIALHETELEALRDENKIFEYKPKLAREIFRLKKIALLTLCTSQCATRTVTTLSNQLANTYVTQNLRDQFQEELKKLGFKNIKIETETKGVKGKQYHYLRLNEANAHNIALKEILSEGEHRCIALSTFLSELTLSSHKSSIIFDDPVSSLDHKWRDKIAKRIAEEAKIRQVIVFTHDISFLLMLQEYCEKEACDLEIKSLTRKKEETGIIASTPPWDALPIKKRIGLLKDQYQKLEKIERTETEEKYRMNVLHLYGRLRETWERFVEEVLLNGAIQRFGREVQTQRLSKLSDLKDEDYQKVDENMSKCSKYFSGHDTAGELMQEPPTSAEFLADLTFLESFADEIRRRRK